MKSACPEHGHSLRPSSWWLWGFTIYLLGHLQFFQDFLEMLSFFLKLGLQILNFFCSGAVLLQKQFKHCSLRKDIYNYVGFVSGFFKRRWLTFIFCSFRSFSASSSLSVLALAFCISNSWVSNSLVLVCRVSSRAKRSSLAERHWSC